MFKLFDRLYHKDEVTHAVFWIVAYVVLASVADGISQDVGIVKLATAPILVVMSVALWAWVSHAGLREAYGLTAPRATAARMLWYFPLAILATKKLWFGVTMRGTALECALFVVSMCCAGFLEEVIFRGLLFRGMEKSNRTSAIVVSSLTFGMGHIVNAFNASGQTLTVTLAQIVFAVSVGFVLVFVLLKCGSIWPCVVFHAVNNALVIFEDEAAQVALFGSYNQALLVSLGSSLVVAALYVLYLMRLPDANA